MRVQPSKYSFTFQTYAKSHTFSDTFDYFQHMSSHFFVYILSLGHSKLISSSSDNHTKNMVASERNLFIYLFFSNSGFLEGKHFSTSERYFLFFFLNKIWPKIKKIERVIRILWIQVSWISACSFL